MKIEFWFDFASTYSYPSAMFIETLAAERGVRVSWRAFMLGAIFNKQGWHDSPFNIYPAKGKYMWRDLQRICDDLAIPFTRPSQFPRSGLLAARIACRFSETSWIAHFVQAVYRANFVLDLDISSVEVISDCLTGLVENPDNIIAEATCPTSKTELRKQTDEALERGIFGAPSFLVDDELFWGSDRLEQAIYWAALRRHP